jgi:micrococcal nuclease
MYEYKCTILRVVDGDSVHATVDVGFRITIEMRFRLTGINAPELNTDAGKLSKKRLLELMPIGSEMIVRTKKDKQEKWGRYLGEFIDSEGHDVNSRMVSEGFAVPYQY